ncbi:hypothetical protein ACGF0D_32360 [Kitasatospora sp. NPDC048298]|uniref:hypothetical protein n=1 Tax=Kitasatospora sp. NPDC048298 TaxID=3364049 RepID=UPI003713CA3E
MVAQIVKAAGRTGRAPLLILGAFERVGSNWVSDQLRASMQQHNEPFRQQLGVEHPLSALNPRPDSELTALNRHHLACALHDLHGSERHAVKETNLFFASRSVTGLLPESPVLVLTRAPLGIASSFERGGLWQRWAYAERYLGLARTARTPRWRDWSPLLPLDDPQPPVALARMIAVNALLLAEALRADLAGCGRPLAHLPYERHVSAPEDVRSGLARFLGVPVAAPSGMPKRGDGGDFDTSRPKSELVAELPASSAALVHHHVATSLARATAIVDAATVKTASHWLAGDDEYELREPYERTRRRVAVPMQAGSRLPSVGYRRSGLSPVTWRNLLISNLEMAATAEESTPCGFPPGGQELDAAAEALPAPTTATGRANTSGPQATTPTSTPTVFFTTAPGHRAAADRAGEENEGTGVPGHAASQRLLGDA